MKRGAGRWSRAGGRRGGGVNAWGGADQRRAGALMNGAGRLGDAPVLLKDEGGVPVKGGVQGGGEAVVLMHGPVLLMNGGVLLGDGRVRLINGAVIMDDGPVREFSTRVLFGDVHRPGLRGL